MNALVDVPFNQALNPELEGEVELGPEVQEHGLVARLGMQPVPAPLDAAVGLDPESPLAKRLAHRTFRLWLVPHNFGVIRRSGFREPTLASLEIRYLSDGRTCSVQGLFPQPQYLQAGELNFESSIHADGSLTVGVGEAQGVTSELAGITVAASSSVGGTLRLRASVEVPVVSAVGIGGDHCEWCFGEFGGSLLGKDIRCWSLLVLPRRQRELKMEMRLRVTHRLAFFAARMDTDWVAVTTALS
jgi:hypothetical protein